MEQKKVGFLFWIQGNVIPKWVSWLAVQFSQFLRIIRYPDSHNSSKKIGGGKLFSGPLEIAGNTAKKKVRKLLLREARKRKNGMEREGVWVEKWKKSGSGVRRTRGSDKLGTAKQPESSSQSITLSFPLLSFSYWFLVSATVLKADSNYF